MKNNVSVPIVAAIIVFLYVFMYRPSTQEKEGYCACGK